MSKETTETKAAKQTKVMHTVELNDDKLEAVAGGYSREDWVLINKEIEKILHPEGR